jgi:hypothetical protein
LAVLGGISGWGFALSKLQKRCMQSCKLDNLHE